MASYKKLETRIRMAVKQISGSVKEEDGSLLSEIAIICKGVVFCFLPATRSFVSIACGTKAILIDEQINEAGRVLIYTFNGHLAEIDPKYITITEAD